MIMLMIFLSFMFLFVNHPLSFGLILLVQTILTAMMTGILHYNYWFSYILFLIMVGGMLVLFMYMTSIASNEKFKFSFKLNILLMTAIFVSMMTFFLNNFQFIKMNKLMMNPNYEMIMNFVSMNKFMNYPSNLMMVMIIIYLLITLIAVIKITSINHGPLRQKT
uniref:NADH-ubiquinone oxidoreductase chain 6 n=1 Tax=Deporaus marginatus TaxID=1544439 RepID=A0A7G7WQ82_9CUCU|nr:NADH dehydrogenase subunit 6 [Deporaus marginatus]QNH68709.1 NADH dehydrogenase subunit 6 [Deporaus marginatus]